VRLLRLRTVETPVESQQAELGLLVKRHGVDSAHKGVQTEKNDVNSTDKGVQTEKNDVDSTEKSLPSGLGWPKVVLVLILCLAIFIAKL